MALQPKGIPAPRPHELQQEFLLEALHLHHRDRPPPPPPPPPFRSPSATSVTTTGSSLNSPASPLVTSSRGLSTSQQQNNDRRGQPTNSADQSRSRFTVQSGFDTLRALLPSLNTGDPQTDSCKISKAALLTKGGDYLKELKDARAQNTLEIKDRKECIARLQSEIKSLQGELPYSGKDGRRRKGSSLGDSTAGDTRQLFLDYIL